MTYRNVGHFFFRQSSKNRQQKTDNRKQKSLPRMKLVHYLRNVFAV
jgi:hypothetical protein